MKRPALPGELVPGTRVWWNRGHPYNQRIPGVVVSVGRSVRVRVPLEDGTRGIRHVQADRLEVRDG